MRTVFIQQIDGEFGRSFQYGAAMGFKNFGYSVDTFDRMDLSNVPVDPSVIVVGGVPVVRAAVVRLDKDAPRSMDLPDCLAHWRGRDVYETTLGNIRSLKKPYFIKPLRKHKAFNGHLARTFRDLITTTACDDDFPVMASEIVEFKSEWRVYVWKGDIVGCCHYNGEPILFPDGRIVRRMVEDFARAGAPAAYGLDVGVVVNDLGRATWLVEVNDGFALGNYGLRDMTYARFLEARWDEMVTFGTPAAATTMNLPRI